jgi:four helix bundle protein
MDCHLIGRHKELDVWKRSLILAETTYVATREFPREERYGLCAQMRRSAVSILSNISEGAARRTRAEYIHFLHIARGSLAELDAQLALAIRLGLAGDQLQQLQGEITRVAQLLNAQIRGLRRSTE